MTQRGSIYIISSDRARNGKTLLARLFADWLWLADEPPFVIDLDAPDAPLAARYPERSLVADFSKITGRVTVFDTIMGDTGRSYVVDIPARELSSFLHEAGEIDFFGEARRAGLDPVFLFIVDRTVQSIERAREVAESHPECMLFPVRNQAIGDALDDEEASELYLDLFLHGEVALPKLSDASLATVESSGFSFRAFVKGHVKAPSSYQYYELSEFCDVVFDQFGKLQFRLDMDELKGMGLI